MNVMYVVVLLFVLLQDLAVTSSKDVTDIWKCPEGWLLKLQSCYRWGTSQTTFTQAEAQCKKWGSSVRVIKNEEENVLFEAAGDSTYYWLGIKRDYNGKWWYMEDNKKHYISYRNFDSSGSQTYYNQQTQCGRWLSTNGVWSSVSCSGQSYLFICQQPPECVSGRFGINCSEECHCKREACNSTTGICRHGCQIGWTGASCNIEKFKAEAKFYCFNVNGENVMMFRVNQRGTKYRSVSSTDYKEGGSDCGKHQFNHFEPGGMATLTVTQHKNGTFKPACGEQKVSAHLVTWKLKFQEFPETSSAYDILFEFTCDFTKADSLTRLLTSNTEKSSNKTTSLTESKVSVSLDIVDPFSDQPVTTVKLGQQVKLQIKLDNVGDFGVSGISPYNCSVSTLDNSHKVIFLDEFGCTPEDAQVIIKSSDLTRWRSDLFEAFTFQGYDKVNFQCNFHVCFSEQHHYCQDMCTYSKKRRSRKLRNRHSSNRNSQEKPTEFGTTVSITT